MTPCLFLVTFLYKRRCKEGQLDKLGSTIEDLGKERDELQRKLDRLKLERDGYKGELEKCDAKAEQNKKSYAKAYDDLKRENSDLKKWLRECQEDLDFERSKMYADRELSEFQYDELQREKEDVQFQLAGCQEDLDFERSKMNADRELSEYQYEKLQKEKEDVQTQLAECQEILKQVLDQAQPNQENSRMIPEDNRNDSDGTRELNDKDVSQESIPTSSQPQPESPQDEQSRTIIVPDFLQLHKAQYREDSRAAAEALYGPKVKPDQPGEIQLTSLVSEQETDEDQPDANCEDIIHEEMPETPEVDGSELDGAFEEVKSKAISESLKATANECSEIAKIESPAVKTSESPSRLLSAFLLFAHLYFFPSFYVLLFAFLVVFIIARKQRKEEQRKKAEAEEAEMQELILLFEQLSIRNKRTRATRPRL